MAEGKNSKGKIYIIIGALLIIMALTADAIGIGVKPGFGWKQGLLLVAGLVIAFMGKKCCACPTKDPTDSPEQKSPPPSDQV